MTPKLDTDRPPRDGYRRAAVTGAGGNLVILNGNLTGGTGMPGTTTGGYGLWAQTDGGSSFVNNGMISAAAAPRQVDVEATEMSRDINESAFVERTAKSSDAGHHMRDRSKGLRRNGLPRERAIPLAPRGS